MKKQQAANALSKEEKNNCQFIIMTLEQNLHELKRSNIEDSNEAFAYIKSAFEKQVNQMKEQTAMISGKLQHLFAFMEKTFGDGNEMLVLVTELTVNYNCAKFIAQNGCEYYYKYNKKFMLHERNAELLHELEKLEAESLELGE